MTTYARVQNGEIMEYPVTEENIANRGLPMSWFLPCEVDKRPDPDETVMVVEVYTVQEDKVLVKYVATPIDPQLVLDNLFDYVTRPRNRPYMGRVPSSTAFATVVNWFEKETQKRLDKFAMERGYTNIFTLTTYATSRVATRKEEGQRGVDLRDQTWDAFYSFLEKLNTGEVEYPSTYSDVAAHLPALTWEDKSEE